MEIAQPDKHLDLIQACKQGNRIAQHQLYRAYARAMYNTSLRIVRDQLQAEDVVQEAFLDAFTHLHRFREDSSFGYWLKQIVVNKSISAYRKLRGDPVGITEDLPEEVSLWGLEEAEREEEYRVTLEVERIKKAIDQLPEGYRMVLILYLLEGYDHEEIAGILSISMSTSRTQYIRGKKKLLELLGKAGKV